MTSKMQHQGAGILISKIRTHAVHLAVWSAIILTPAVIASPSVHAQTYQVIHHFAFGSDEGAYPNGLTRDAAGPSLERPTTGFTLREPCSSWIQPTC